MLDAGLPVEVVVVGFGVAPGNGGCSPAMRRRKEERDQAGGRKEKKERNIEEGRNKKEV